MAMSRRVVCTHTSACHDGPYSQLTAAYLQSSFGSNKIIRFIACVNPALAGLVDRFRVDSITASVFDVDYANGGDAAGPPELLRNIPRISPQAQKVIAIKQQCTKVCFIVRMRDDRALSSASKARGACGVSVKGWERWVDACQEALAAQVR